MPRETTLWIYFLYFLYYDSDGHIEMVDIYLQVNIIHTWVIYKPTGRLETNLIRQISKAL